MRGALLITSLVLGITLAAGCGDGRAGDAGPGVPDGDDPGTADPVERPETGEPDLQGERSEDLPSDAGDATLDAHDLPDDPEDLSADPGDATLDARDVSADEGHVSADARDLPADAGDEAIEAGDVSPEAGDASGDTSEVQPDDATPSLDADPADVPSDAAEEVQADPGPPVDSDGDGLSDADERARGTDPSNPDTDEDGQPDGQEVADGTGPTDPSSALAWHPERVERPRLFFGPADLPAIRERLARPEEPFLTLAARLRATAAQTPPEHPEGLYDSRVAQTQGWLAEGAALAGLLFQDADATAKALSLITKALPDPADGLVPKTSFNLEEAEALSPLCTAYDLVAGTPGVDAEVLAAARTALVLRIDRYRWMCHEGPSTLMLLSSPNNHAMKYFAAMGNCALAVNDRPEAALDLSEAVTGLDWTVVRKMSSEEGAWGEGWNYMDYGGRTWVPFFAAYHRYAQGRTLPYYGVPNLQPSDTPHSGHVDPVPDFATSPRMHAVFLRALWSLQPDGRMPNTDDANPVPLAGGLLAGLLDDPRLLWAWFRPGTGFPDLGGPTATIAAYDGTPPPADPGLPLEGSAVDAGFAIFRSSWEADATYLVLQGEHGAARMADPGHEHPDELSFLLWHGGRSLILDPGYINYANHGRVMYATDHNTILVDGQGSPYVDLLGTPVNVGVDAFLSAMESAGRVTWVSVDATYRDVDFRRRVVRIDGRFFVVEDRMEGRGASHAYTFLLNGMGGGEVPDSDFSVLADGARWRNGPAWVEAHVQPVGGEAVRSDDIQEHCTTWGGWAMHGRLKVEATMSAPAGFLSVIVPGIEGQDAPALSVSRPAPGVVVAVWQDGGATYLAGSNQSASPFDWADGGEHMTLAPGLTVRIQPAEGGAEVRLLAP